MKSRECALRVAHLARMSTALRSEGPGSTELGVSSAAGGGADGAPQPATRAQPPARRQSRTVIACARTVVTALLEVRNKECKDRLDAMRPAIHAGRRMNQLCDAFWTCEVGFNKDTWPANERQVALRELLITSVGPRDGKFTVAEVDTWAQQLGLELPPWKD